MVDLDTLFSYQTIKIVRIYDRRLGILHYAFELAILVYIIVYTIIVQQRYLRSEAPFGSVRATIQEPTPWANATSLSYCAQNQPYLVNGNGNFTNYPCTYLQGYDATYPPAPLNSLFATTRVKDTISTIPANCTDPRPLSHACVPSIVGTSAYYTADIEQFTIFMEHAIYGRLNDITLTNSGLDGVLTYADGRPAEALSGVRGGDIFTLKTMLDAAGVSTLDVVSGVAGGHTYRYDGLEIVVVVTYQNSASHPSVLTYSYSLTAIPAVDSVAMEPSVKSATTGLQSTRHGINFLFIISGTIGLFDFQTLLVSLVSGLALLKVASTIVDLLLLYVMPDKQKYKDHKYEETADFSDERKQARELRET